MDSIFDIELELPNKEIADRANTLIGFDAKYKRISSNLRLLQEQEAINSWSEKNHGQQLPILTYIQDKYPLIILAGDAGTGKTVTAEAIADQMVRDLHKEGYFIRLSTRVRGEGLHGQMGNLVNDAFKRLRELAGKKRLCYLLIDEADAVATTRSTLQMHQEEKAAVNTLIQKIDEIRDLKGRAVVMMSTNRLHFLDEAIIRRAAVIMEFKRPDNQEREEFFRQSLSGLPMTDDEIKQLTEKTGPGNGLDYGYSYSDLRLRLLPEVVAYAFTRDEPITFDVVSGVIDTIKPSPVIS